MATMQAPGVALQTDTPTDPKKRLSGAVQIPFPGCFLAQSDNGISSRFRASYDQLKSLPRRARRALQRQLAKYTAAYDLPDKLQSHKTGRTLRHKLAWSLAGAALLLALGQNVQAATITVTTKKPAINAGDGLCSLAEAIINANDNAATYADCTAGDVGPDTIILPRGTHNITAPTAYVGPVLYYVFAGLPLITSEIIIEGNGAKISRSGSAAPASIMICTASGNLTLNSVTVQGGYGPIFGGGILNFGTLTVNNSKITKNYARRGGGIYTSGLTAATTNINNSSISKYYSAAVGGGIATGDAFNAPGGTVNINLSQISKNTVSTYWGGGIYNAGGTVTVTNSTISGNKAVGNFSRGGGVTNGYGGTINIQNSLISKNQAISDFSAARGGGINNGANLIINNSSIDKNQAIFGGGIYNNNTGYNTTITNSTISKNQVTHNQYYYSFGGGIDNTNGTLSLTNSTVSGNKSDGYAGGVNNYGSGTLTIENSTITKNQANYFGGGIYNTASSTLILNRSLISGNKISKSGFGPEISTYGVFAVDDFNLFGSDNNHGITGTSGPGATDIVPPLGVKSNTILSGQLKDNGGPPAASGKANSTHALVPGSPAVDAAPCVLGTGQRGVARPQGLSCDIGAFELGP